MRNEPVGGTVYEWTYGVGCFIGMKTPTMVNAHEIRTPERQNAIQQGQRTKIDQALG